MWSPLRYLVTRMVSGLWFQIDDYFRRFVALVVGDAHLMADTFVC